MGHPINDIVTPRLALIAITPESVGCEKAGDGQLGTVVEAMVPAAWPPEHWEPHVFDLLLERFAADATDVGWHRYIALGQDDGTRMLIGTLGGFRRTERPEECEIGYSVLPEFQGRGLGTEGMRAFVVWALGHPGISTITAQTLPSLPASIRVMEKLGMTFEGAGCEEGTILYRLDRPTRAR